jgi:hypothetical protein
VPYACGRYLIRKLALRVHEPHGRLVKLINVYYSPKKVASLSELRMPDNADKWHFCVAIPVRHLAAVQSFTWYCCLTPP